MLQLIAINRNKLFAGPTIVNPMPSPPPPAATSICIGPSLIMIRVIVIIGLNLPKYFMLLNH